MVGLTYSANPNSNKIRPPTIVVAPRIDGPAPATGILGVGGSVGVACATGAEVVTAVTVVVVVVPVLPPLMVTVFLHVSGVPVKTKLLSRTLQEAPKLPDLV